MADDLQQSLQELFVKHGTRIKPGDDLLFKHWELPEGQHIPYLNSVRDEVKRINQGGDRTLCFSPLYNIVIHIFHKLEFVSKYFAGEFEIRCKNRYFREQFARIWPDFIRGWYFQCVYVGYGADFESIDEAIVTKRGEDFRLDYVTGRFRLYTKSSDGTFHSILVNQSGIKFDKEQRLRLVKCECTPAQQGMGNWMYWWYLWNETLDGIDRYQRAVKALSKKVILTPKNDDEKVSILEQMNDKGTIVSRSSSSPFGEGGDTSFTIGKTKVEPLEFMNNDTPSRIFEGIQKWFEFHAAHLGFAGSYTEPKKERLTAAENWPKQKVVSNIRTYLINSLNRCFDEMRFRFGDQVVPDDLKIVPSNQAFAQGLPSQQMGGTFANEFQPNYMNKFKQEEEFRGND